MLGTRVQGDPVKVPVSLLEKSTVPVGVIGPELRVSVTVAAQVVDESRLKDEGEQETVVEVGSSRLADRMVWLGWWLVINAPRESLAEPVAPELSTTRSVTLVFTPTP